MVIRTRIQPIQRDTQVMISEMLSPKARSAALANFAKEQLAEAQEHNHRIMGRVPPHETYVDRRRGAPLESVKPEGTIVIEFDLLDDLFAWIGEQLVKHAPVLTGRFQRSFAFFADGVEIEPGAALNTAQEYVFLNTQPYARKIERGQSDQAPDGVFEAVAALAKKRFGNVVNIRFSYRTPIAAASGSGREKRAADRANRQPAIVITTR